MNRNEILRRLCSAVFLSLICVFAYSQGRQIHGVVKDNTGEPMIGVNVLVKGTTNGTITDLDGNFTIQGVSATDVIVVSYIGYITSETTVGSQSEFNIVLKEDSETLDEVVVIGYGTVKRRDLTGSVASVSGEKIAANPVPTVAQALQGQLPGVTVTSQDGRPGGTMSIRVRGGGSITQSNDPLFIVDGVQVSTIDDIPADNIESIDVLKDAATTAIYGASGANGVILITTKGGKSGRTVVKYGLYYQLKTNPKTLDVLDAYDYVFGTWAYATAYGTSYGDNVAQYFGLGSSYGNHLSEYKSMKSHNYVDDVMKNASTWNHDVSISGGGDKTTFYAGLSYSDDQGTRINSSFSRWSANFKVTQKITKDLTLDVDLRYTEVGVEGTKFDIATSAYEYKPIDNPLGDATYTTAFGNGSANVEDDKSPVAIINNYDNFTKAQRLSGKLNLTWNIIKGLTAKTELSLRRNWNNTEYWDAGLENGYSTAQLTKKDGYNVRWATTVNYEVQGLGDDHSLSFLVGNEILASKSNTSWIYGSGYPEEWGKKEAFGNINMTDSSLGKDEYGQTIGTPNHTLSFFARGNYSYKGKYLLTATFRADGSSKFGPNNHWGYFPAAAIAWRLSDEAFMEGTRDWLDNLKIRVSFGTSGADNIDSSLWKSTWTTEQITVDSNTVTTYVPGDMQENPDLKWETTTQRNFGIDFGFLNNRIHGSIDAYWNTTKDLLIVVPVNSTSGYSYQMQNMGKTSNKGIEVALGLDLVHTKNFNLNLNLTYNYNKNNVDELDVEDNDFASVHTGWGSSMRVPYYDYVIQEGKPVGLIQAFKADGYYKVSDFTYSNGMYTLNSGVPDTESIVNYAGGDNFTLADGQTAFPGMVKFKDVNGDGIINDDDATVVAVTTPKHTGGFTFNGNWKSIDFTLGFTYQIGGNVYNANSMYAMMGNKDNNLGANRLAVYGETFKIYDVDSSGDLYAVTDPTALETLNANAKYALPYSEYGIATSEFVEDASYLRLQTLTVGYTFPKVWTKKVGIENARIYFTGSNLFCINGYSGIDPDVNTNPDAGSYGFPTPNYDFNSYPKSRTYTFGFNITF